MRIQGLTSIGTLLEQHPWADEILRWHGLDDVDPRLSLDAACWLRGRDRERVLADLWAAAPDHVSSSWRPPTADDAPDDEWHPIPSDATFASDAYWDLYADDLLARPT